MSEQLLYFNGIDGDTGSYDLPPMSAEELMRVIRGETTPENLNELRFRRQQTTTEFLGVKEGVDATKLEEAGWGVIFPTYPVSEENRQKEVDAIREALQPLLQLRRKQAGERFKEWTQGEGKGFRVGVDTKNNYLARHGAGPGPADPDKVPYYLLIVGSPADTPYRFQSQLDVQYAVGRIHFKTLDEYAAYAASVVAAETSPKKLARQAAFFGVANPEDPATQLSLTALAEPLAGSVQANHSDWTVQSYMSSQATKAVLASLLGGDKTPSLLFTASHGMKFAKDSPRQLPHQGALLCQDWPGPHRWIKQIPQDFYFAGDDLAGSADLLGLIAFFFACYGGGTPQFNEFTQRDRPGVTPTTRPEIAPFPFLAQLPTKMLGRPRGALAVVAHVERAWSYSFRWGKAGNQTLVFESTLKRLLNGHPIGSAVEYFNERYAELSTVLSDELEEIGFGKRYDPLEMAGMWTANNDARGYAVIGDPAVRLPVVQGSEQPAERSVIEVQPITATVPTGGAASTAGEFDSTLATPTAVDGDPRKLDEAKEKIAFVDAAGPAMLLPVNDMDALKETPVIEPVEVRRQEVQASERPAAPGGQPEKPPATNTDQPGGMSYLPQPEPDANLAAMDPELYKAWQKHIIAGFEQNEEMFKKVLDAFMRPYQTTVWMYRLLFGVGLGSFIFAAVMSAATKESSFGLIFGGLGVIAFLSYFISRPLQALEQNLQFITWLGVVYNTYWTRLATMKDPATVQKDLVEATRDTTSEIEKIIAKHAEMSGKRPGLS